MRTVLNAVCGLTIAASTWLGIMFVILHRPGYERGAGLSALFVLQSVLALTVSHNWLTNVGWRGLALVYAYAEFLDRYGELIDLSTSGQLAMRQLLQAHLKRVTWDEQRLPIRLHPFVVADNINSEKPIAIDPQIAFGRPVIIRRGISTAAIVDRIDAGEAVEQLAADYDLTVEEIDEAVLYERAA